MTSSSRTDDFRDNGWILVLHEDQYTKARSPQYNEVNESQTQKASTSCDVSIVLAPVDNISGAEEEDEHAIMRRKTESNGTSSETTASVDTMTALDNGGLARTMGTPSTHSTAPDLTESKLDLLQRELHQRFVGTIDGWLAGTGGLDRFTADFASSMPNSMLARMGRSPSSVSSISLLDLEPAPPVRSLTHDIRGIGSWVPSNMHLPTLVRR